MKIEKLSQFDFLFIQGLMAFIATTILISKNPNSMLDCDAGDIIYELAEYQKLTTQLVETGKIDVSLKDYKDLTKRLMISVENLIF